MLKRPENGALKEMKKTILIALVILMMLFGCKKKNTTAPVQTPQVAPTAAAQAAETPENKDGRVTGLHFTYDMYSGEQFYLDVHVSELTERGAKAELTKRVGPMNYTGHKMEGELQLTGEQADTLLEILGRYDLAAWSKLPTSGSGSAPSRSLLVFSGNETIFDIRWNAKFPETLPPQEDIMYAELYNFFNGLIADAPGWEEVRSEDLDDPRENAAYGGRTVTWFGHEVKLVPGTGTWHEDGSYADIDYEGKDWWIEEGFTGRWTLDREQPTDGPNEIGSASLKVMDDGSILFKLDGEEWPGSLSSVRRYKDSVYMTLERDGEKRSCEVGLMYEESYERIHIRCYPGPVPEPQFTPIDVYLVKMPG